MVHLIIKWSTSVFAFFQNTHQHLYITIPSQPFFFFFFYNELSNWQIVHRVCWCHCIFPPNVLTTNACCYCYVIVFCQCCQCCLCVNCVYAAHSLFTCSQIYPWVQIKLPYLNHGCESRSDGHHVMMRYIFHQLRFGRMVNKYNYILCKFYILYLY